MFSSPLPFWGGGGTRRQASTLGEVEEVREQQPSSRTTNYSARAQTDLKLIIPESGSVQTVQNRLCECIMDRDSTRLVPCSPHRPRCITLGTRDVPGEVCAGLGWPVPGGTRRPSVAPLLPPCCPPVAPLLPLCCPSTAADALSHCATCPHVPWVS